MTIRHWRLVKEVLPPEGEIVQTMSAHGLEQELKRTGKLWFIPDGTMYVYYEIIMWRPIS